MIVVGLTGSIGMGKTTTANMFAAEGVPVFDADAAVHDLYEGPAVAAVEAAFPGVTRNGAIDRALLGEKVVGNAAATRRLETIVHPLVRRAREAFLAKTRTDHAPIAVLDIPLLFETGQDADVDVVVVASAPESVQKARVMRRPGMTEARFNAILNSQIPDAEKRRRARYVIETGEGRDLAARQVRAVITALESG